MGGDQIGENGKSGRAKGGDGMVGGLAVRNMDGIGQKRSDDKKGDIGSSLIYLYGLVCLSFSGQGGLVQQGYLVAVWVWCG
jgi:hypothetical protein